MTILFLLLTLFFWIGTAGLAKVWYFSIQEDQWMDSLFGWQKMIAKFGMKTGAMNAIISKALGGCEFCFGHMVAFLCFWFYVVIMCNEGIWPTYDTAAQQWVFNIIMFLIYDCVATTLNSLVINRL